MRKILLVKMAILAACLSVRASGPSVAITTTFPKSGNTAVTCKATPTGSFIATPEFDPDDKDEIIINGPQFHWMISPVENVSFSPTDAATVDVSLADNAFGKSYDVSVIVTWIVWDKVVLDFRIITATDTMTLVALNIKLKSVDFMGTGNHLIGKQDNSDWTDDTFEDDATVRINYAEWQDNDLNLTPEKSDPVCYTKGSFPNMTAIIFSAPQAYKVSAKLRVLNNGTILLRRDISLNGDATVPNLIWESALPATLRNQDYTLTWQVSLDGGANYMGIGTSVNRFFVVYDAPKYLSSRNRKNAPSCRRLDTILTEATMGGETADIDTIAQRIQDWRDSPGMIDNSGNFGDVQSPLGSMFWGLLDTKRNPRLKGQCGEGSELMDLAIHLLGIEAMYRHIEASTNIPIRINSAPLRRTHCSGNEWLLLYFTSFGDFGGGNAGEGCCLVNEVLYDAFAGGHSGKAGTFVNGTIAVSPEHSILLQLEWIHDRLQRWMKSRDVECDNKSRVPVPTN